MYSKTNEDAIIQNLLDAGCDNKTIHAFMKDIRENKMEAGLKLLAIHRRALLDDIHKEQKQIDCLDYLVYTIQKAK